MAYATTFSLFGGGLCSGRGVWGLVRIGKFYPLPVVLIGRGPVGGGRSTFGWCRVRVRCIVGATLLVDVVKMFRGSGLAR
jgi:hypothetical protein